MYQREFYTKVLDDLSALRLKNERALNQRRENAFSKTPRLRQIEREMSDNFKDLGIRILNSDEMPELILEAAQAKTQKLKQEQELLLKELSLSPDYLKMEYSCIVCHDKGVVSNKFCNCFNKRLAKYAALDSNLSPIMATQNFDYFDFQYYSATKDNTMGFSPRKNMENILKTCLKFVNTFDNCFDNLFMFGPSGLGKTFLSSCIAKDLIEKGKSIFYQSAPKIFKIMEDYKFGRGDLDSLKVIIDRIYSCDLLIIDDLGTEMATSFSSSTLFDIINTRIIENKKTIINTNFDLNELKEIYAERVVSRIIGHYTQLEFFGKDIRLSKLDK